MKIKSYQEGRQSFGWSRKDYLTKREDKKRKQTAVTNITVRFRMVYLT